MAHRFFTHDSLALESASLEDEQAHHFLNVMRGKVGQEVVLFDGSGVEAVAKVIATTKKAVELEVLSRESIDRELGIELVLAVALPKGDRQKVLVEKLVEVGVTKLLPMATSRSVAQPTEKALQRLRKSIVEASKQCERNVLMELLPPTTFAEILADAAWAPVQKLIATTHIDGVPILAVESAKQFLILVGPEGGFSAEENQLAQSSGFQAITLGKRKLRVETAAIVAASSLGLRTR